MTPEMEKLYTSLSTIKVKNVTQAYDYLGNEVNGLDMDHKLSFEMTLEALKNINKEYKLLKKYYKGKIDINLESVYTKYPEDSEEYFFLKCLIRLTEYNVTR